MLCLMLLSVNFVDKLSKVNLVNDSTVVIPIEKC